MIDPVGASQFDLQAADVGVFTSQMESFCLSSLEAMTFSCPSVAFAGLLRDPVRRRAMDAAACERAHAHFSAEIIVPRYEALYRRLTTQA